ncbi:MAG: septum site-determining protein MinC [Deltaproteobacteria bacterium]|nr:septum site-determining protein MinC [Deltaproteobacteria bacterium]
MQGYIAIKGTRNGLLLTLEPGTPFSDLLTALSERLSEAPSFFKGASLSLDTTRRTLEAGERTQLEALLAYYQMSVAAAQTLTETPVLQAEAAPVAASSEPQPVIARDEQAVGSTATLSAADPVETANTANTLDMASIAPDPRESSDTLFLRRTVRSGQAINHPSNVVVLGDVNHGAEIVAGGDIIVWGVLRGMVHAGYPDNEQALVCSLALAPVQLRIAHLLSRPPEGFEVQPRPEVAAIRNDQIVVEAWINGRPSRR